MSTGNINGNNKIRVKCSCGKKLSVKEQYAGKALKCPACGGMIAIPHSTASSISTKRAEPTIDDSSENISRNSIYMMSSIVGAVALGCILVIIWHQYSANQEKIRVANTRVNEISNKVSSWLEKNPRQFDESLLLELNEVLASEYATETKKAKNLLEKLKAYQKQLQTETLYQAAIDQLREGKPAEAVELLKKYNSSQYAVNKEVAQKLIKEIELATSDDLMYEILIDMSEEEFSLVTQSGLIKYEKVTHPQVQNILKDTLNRTRDKASKERDSRKIAMENKLEQEKLEAMELQRLRTRSTNVRNVCWGDSQETVRKVEEVNLTNENGTLIGNVEFDGKNATLHYFFYDNKLVQMYYFIDFGQSGNPFESDSSIRYILEEKYGEGKFESFGITDLGVDLSEAGRSTTWKLSDHTVVLSAFAFSSKRNFRNIILTYKANTPEYKAYVEQGEKESHQKAQERKDKLLEKL